MLTKDAIDNFLQIDIIIQICRWKIWEKPFYKGDPMIYLKIQGPVYTHGERMHLKRLKMAIKYKQKRVSLCDKKQARKSSEDTQVVMYAQF